MATTIAVVPDGKRWKILINYIQRGIAFSTATLANREAIKISESEHCDHLILAKEEA